MRGMADDVVVRPDQVTLGVLVSTVGRDVIDDAVAVHGVGARRSNGKLPAHVTAYLTMAMCLFADDAYEEVAAKVTGSLSRFGVWDAAWTVPSASGITQARKRLGSGAMREIFEGVAGPVATTDTRGAWVRGRRVLAIDGFEVDVPDTPANAERFSRSGSSKEHVAAYPKARVVALSECGTHAFLAAEVDSSAVGESTLAGRIYPRLRPDELLTADRNFYSYQAWGQAAGTGAALLWRAPTGLALPVLQVLPDGTYIAVVINPKIHNRSRREKVLTAARAGQDLDTLLDDDTVHLVRVVEYDVPDRAGNGNDELIVLLTTITDPADARADELAAIYHQRWQEETTFAQLKTHLRGPGRVLRSRLPDLVLQEIWAWLTVHYAIAVLIARAAEAADIDPDRVSFTRVLRLVRRSATGTADIPP
jgi:Insertion element 4 transposase N-terminal/Transposase DDE domain